MTLKRIYNLNSQRVTYRHENLSKMGICILLILFVICGIIGLTVFLVKSAQLSSEKVKYGQVNYHDTGNNKKLQANKKHIQRPDIRNDYLSTTIEGKVVATSNTAEFTSTTIESPLSTSTISPIDVPARFLIINSVNTNEITSSDYSTAGSTNDYVKLTTDRRTEEISFFKRSTKGHLTNDEPITPAEDYVDTYLQRTSVVLNDEPITRNRNTERFTTTEKSTTPTTRLEADSNGPTCKTNFCKQSTSRMLALIDHHAEPCEDFYSYACGGFDINHFKEFTVKDNILESLPDLSTMDLTVPYKKLYHDFFFSCTNYKNGNGLKELSKWLYDLCQNNKENLTDLIADLILIHPQKTLSRLLPLFDVVMEVGPEKTLIPTVSLPKLNSLLSEDDDTSLYERSCLNLAEMETINKKNKTIIQETYKACIEDQNEYFKNLEKSIFLLQIFEHLPDFTKKQTIQKTLQFIDQNIIDKFGSISDIELRNPQYVTVSLKWLTDTYSKIEREKLFLRLFGREVAKNITAVRLTHSTYLMKIFEFYESHSFENIKTSILSMMAHDMYVDFIEPISSSDRYKYCLNVATKLMPDIVSMLYLENFSKTDIANMEQKLKLMSEQLIATFNSTLIENVWIKENERNDVSKKISELNVISNPYEGFINFKETYNQLYSGVKITTDDFILNTFALRQVVRRRMYDTYGKSAVSPEVIWNYLAWPIAQQPIRIPEMTAIVIPTSLIARFTTESQKIEEFSTIGFLVAQEISHLFYSDKTSKLFVNDIKDFMTNMESNLQDPAYTKKPNIFGIQLNQKDITTSQHSRFIDEVALRVTFDAYNQHQSAADKLMPWTNDPISKVFYLLTSQQFCIAKKSTVEVAIDLIHSENLPNYFRVNSMMNSETILKTFECRN